MGLKEFLEGLTGKDKGPQRGRRDGGSAGRGRDERTGLHPVEAWNNPRDTTSPPPAGGSPAPPNYPPAEPVAPPPQSPPPANPAPVAPPPAPHAAVAPAPTAPPPVAQPAPPPPPPPAPRPGASAGETLIQPLPDVFGEVHGVLVGIGGELKGKMFAVRDGKNVIGRNEPKVDICLMDDRVSREHATIQSIDGAFVVEPLKSPARILVNGESRDDAFELFDGDSLRFGIEGASVFRFRTIEGQ